MADITNLLPNSFSVSSVQPYLYALPFSLSLSTFSSSLSIPRRADLLVETGRPLPAHQPPAGKKRLNVCVFLLPCPPTVKSPKQSISSGAQNEVQTTTTTTPPQPLFTKVCAHTHTHTRVSQGLGVLRRGLTTQGGWEGGKESRRRRQRAVFDSRWSEKWWIPLMI